MFMQRFFVERLSLFGIGSDGGPAVREACSCPGGVCCLRERGELLEPGLCEIRSAGADCRLDSVERCEHGDDRVRDRLELCHCGRCPTGSELDCREHPA